jgi:hypothetical protein
MLEFLEKFDVLRQRVFAGIDADDIDEIEWREGRKSFFYAQRDGAQWSDRRHHALKKPDIGGLLEGITHIRVMRFMDDPASASKTYRLLDTAPARQIVLTDRQGHPIRLNIKRIGNELFGTTSTRPEAVFGLYPESIRFFEVR